jgi:predicted DNA-binding transcriptional regulator AlpA
MGRKVDADNLVGAAEIAERLGAKRVQRVHEWMTRDPSFPRPVAKLKAAHVWNWPDVERWAKKNDRLPK